MTHSLLSLYIAIAVLTQVAVVSLLAFRRHWQAYGALRGRLAGFEGYGYGEGAADPAFSGAPTAPPVTASMAPRAGWQGFRLLCVARKVIEDQRGEICSFYLQSQDGTALPPFLPGQYLTFRLDCKDGSHVLRCYSLSDQSGLDHYRISVKRVSAPPDHPELPAGYASNLLHHHVAEGDVLSVRAPGGHFYLERGAGPVVLIAGGIGITPLLSMVLTSLATGEARQIWLFYGVRNSAEQIMKEQLEALASQHDNFHLHVCYSQPLPEDREGLDYQHHGRVHIDLLRLTLPFAPLHFYICGSPAMMQTVVPALDAWGVPDSHIHFEAFGPASIARPSRNRASGSAITEASATSAEPVTVTFRQSGVSAVWQDGAGSLLELAEDNGITLESGCRAGGCGACQIAIEDGEVDYPHPPDYDPDVGTCLPCVARPKRDLILSA